MILFFISLIYHIASILIAIRWFLDFSMMQIPCDQWRDIHFLYGNSFPLMSSFCWQLVVAALSKFRKWGTSFGRERKKERKNKQQQTGVFERLNCCWNYGSCGVGFLVLCLNVFHYLCCFLGFQLVQWLRRMCKIL